MYKVQGVRLQGIPRFKVRICDKRKYRGQDEERTQDASYIGAALESYARHYYILEVATEQNVL